MGKSINPRIAAVVQTYKSMTEEQRRDVCSEAIKLLGQTLCEQVVHAMERACVRVLNRGLAKAFNKLPR